MRFAADFETTTDPNDCRVWAWGVCDIDNTDFFVYGNSIDSFYEFMQMNTGSTFYFHNKKFDISFIYNYLFRHGYTYVEDKKQEDSNTFSALISVMGAFYSTRIVFEKKNKKKKFVTILDSLKIIPFSIDSIAKNFGLPVSKLEIDYKAYREPGHILTAEEIAYLKNDVLIAAMALHILFDRGLDKMTQASNALFDYKNEIGMRAFTDWFPTPDNDADLRQAYKGGFTYLPPDYREKDVTEGLVFDVNSLYPWALRYCPLPYGEGIYFEGEYKPDPLYNLYVQKFTCQFELKPGKIPTLQLKENLLFKPTEYLTSCKDKNGKPQDVTLCMSSVDLELFKEHYEILNPQWHCGWKFKSTTGLFAKYIDKWMEVKIEADKSGNKGYRTLAKLMMNALYGKFSLNPKVANKIVCFEDGKVVYKDPRYEEGDLKGQIIWETRKALYIPVGIFVTAWARHKTVSSAQKLYKYFRYADTDSCHIEIPVPDSIKAMSEKELKALTTETLREHGVQLPDGFEVDPVRLGAWKCESMFHRARFLRQKCYIEDSNTPDTWGTAEYDPNLMKITCSGMPDKCYPHVTWDNFRIGARYPGRLRPVQVPGGQVLVEQDFTIRQG